MDSADGASIGVGPIIAHYANRHHRQQHSKGLPNLRVKSGSFDFRDYDVIGFLKQLHPLRRDLAQNSNRESRPGKWLTLQNLFRHAEIATNAADFILEEILQ